MILNVNVLSCRSIIYKKIVPILTQLCVSVPVSVLLAAAGAQPLPHLLLLLQPQ